MIDRVDVDIDIMDVIAGGAGATPAQLPGWFVDLAGRMGYEAEEARTRLIHVGHLLVDRVAPPAAGLVREFAARLESWRLHIAVIGETKTDASTFVWAFAGRPDLLPTAGESRATSVTRVHFNLSDERSRSATLRPIEGFADILESADVHLGAESFVCPLTLIATPGVSDPFLMRDEITLGSIEGAEACVLVVPVRQALSNVDGDLLRIVHALRKDRLLVFLDGIDTLDEPTRQAARALDHMRALLLRELQVDIPVIAGSTRWAAVALQSAASGAGLDDAPWSYAKAIGVVAPRELDDILTGPVAARAARLAPLLHAMSGFHQVYGEIGKLSHEISLTGGVRDAATAFSAIVRQSEGAVRGELTALEESVRTAHHDVMTDSWELHRLKGEIARLEDVLDRLDCVFEGRRGALHRLRTDAAMNLRRQLADAVKDYVQRERTAIVVALDRKVRKTGMRFDMSGMRGLLEQTFVAHVRKLHQALIEAEESAAGQLLRLTEAELPGLAAAAGSGRASGSFIYPRLAALSRIDAFDIDPKLWSRWRRWQPGVQETIAEFERVLTVEFFDVANELGVVADREVAARVAALIDRLSRTWSTAAAAVTARRQELQARIDDRQRGLEPHVIDGFLREQIHGLSECRERLMLFVGLTRSLRELVDGLLASECQAQEAG